MEDFTSVELETKMRIQKVMMDIFGYVYDDKKQRPLDEQISGMNQWASEDGGEKRRMATLFGEVCNKPEIRGQLAGGFSEKLVQDIKTEMEKILYPEMHQEEGSERRAA